MPRSVSLPTLLSSVALTISAASPAWAGTGSIALPEPSALLLLGMGIAGVAIGRRFSSKRPRD